jgi:ParB family chromosome partitioning protein
LLSTSILEAPIRQSEHDVLALTAVDGSGKKLNISYLPVERLQRSPYQPRRDFDEEALQELSASIKAQGIIQPIVARMSGDGRQYEIIAGERRWRAAQMAGLHEVPVVIHQVPDEAAMAMAIIENLQREDLNPLEEAMGLERLMTEFHMTHQDLADAVGKSRASVTNLLRLLTLKSELKTMLEHRDIEMGHARAMLGLVSDQQLEVARLVVARGLSVRQTEELVRRYQQDNKSSATTRSMDPDVKSLQDKLSGILGAQLEIRHGAKGRGKLVINYNSLEELDGILAHIS